MKIMPSPERGSGRGLPLASDPRPAGPPDDQRPPDVPEEKFVTHPLEATGGPLVGALTAGVASYAGTLGGAVVGSALGGGVGLILGALSQSSPLGWLGTSFRTAGQFGRLGIVLGAGAGIVGGYSVGRQVGARLGRGLDRLWIPGHNPMGRSQPLDPPHGLARVQAGVLAGTGLVAGATGGFLGGAALVGAGKVAAGLLSGQLSWAAAGSAALTAGAVGAVSLGALGAVGGWKTSEGLRRSAPHLKKAWDWATRSPQNGYFYGAAVGGALLASTGALGRLPIPVVGWAASGILGHAVGFGVARAMTTPEHRDVLTFAHCMAIGGVVSMFTAGSVLPLPASLLGRAVVGAVGGALLGHKIERIHDAVNQR